MPDDIIPARISPLSIENFNNKQYVCHKTLVIYIFTSNKDVIS